MDTEQTQKPQLTALYCRLSREDNNDGPSNSIENQKRLLEAYAKRMGYEPARIYADDGISGTTFDRPAFNRMIRGIKSGRIGRVIVKDMSRLGRDYLQVGFYTEVMFPERGVHFIAVNDNVDSAAAPDDLLPFRNIINEWYARDTSRKVRAVLHAKGMSGKALSSCAPYGYRKGEDGTLQPDPETAPVLRRIFTLYAEGMTCRRIARLLEEEQVPTPGTLAWLREGIAARYHPEHPCRWCDRTIKDMLARKTYLGHTVNFQTRTRSYKDKRTVRLPESEQVVFENTHPPLISRALWEQVQRRRNQKAAPAAAGTEQTSI